MTHLLTREEVAFAILGDLPGVYMTDAHDVAKGQPFAVAAMMAEDPDDALVLATELQESIAKGFPAWRGWGIEYAPADPGADAGAA